ncbi:hypothetical protein J7I98_23885 [Streptomyces sp. ISL-98]|nr:hypothetical protein [Streptomyces sp. ISL-98]
MRVTDIAPPQPTTLAGVYRAAARVMATNHLHQGDMVADAFDRVLTTPHATRPMCVTGAIRTAVSGDPHTETPLASLAIRFLADRLLVDGCGPYGDDDMAAEFHLASWCDVVGRTTESVCAVLYPAADASEVSA